MAQPTGPIPQGTIDNWIRRQFEEPRQPSWDVVRSAAWDQVLLGKAPALMRRCDTNGHIWGTSTGGGPAPWDRCECGRAVWGATKRRRYPEPGPSWGVLVGLLAGVVLMLWAVARALGWV